MSANLKLFKICRCIHSFPITLSKQIIWLLDEALQKDYIEIQETSESGSVPELKVLNKCGRKILLLDGEELLGAKQNRILNLSVMVPAKT